MKITEAQLKRARELAAKHGCKELFINEKGEFFTSQNYAALSVKNNKEKWTKVELGNDVKVEKTTTDLEKAAEVIAKIEASTEVSAIELIVKAESEGRNRKSVIDAGAKKIESLSKNAQ
jgi:hypothetical protein